MPKKLPRIIIAIDGFSSTGKSTVAQRLAKTLGYVYVDTGAMYRAVTLYALENGMIVNDQIQKKKLIAALPKIDLQFVFNKELGFAEMYLNGKNVEKQIRSIKVADFVSPIAAISEVRKYLVAIQRKMGKDKGIVMDGRDIGSVVFPEAELKIFLTATPDIRAKRRLLEMQEKGIDADFETILKNVEERDYIDSNRADSPLIKTKDAIEVDVSNIDKEEQFNLILGLAHKAIVKNIKPNKE